MSTNLADDVTRKSVMDLLLAALEARVGVAIEPDDEGWRISYVLPCNWPAHTEYELAAGPLSSAYDLGTAAAAAIRPLNEMGAMVDQYLERRS
jgi:hypothetical protein